MRYTVIFSLRPDIVKEEQHQGVYCKIVVPNETRVSHHGNGSQPPRVSASISSADGD